MQSKQKFVRALVEHLEERRLLTVSPLSAGNLESLLPNPSSFEAASAVSNDGSAQQTSNHGFDHGDAITCGCPECCAVLDGIYSSAREGDSDAGQWNSGTARDLTHVVTIQPIVVSNSDGSNTAEYFGGTVEQAHIQDLIDQVWAQAGIDIEWLAPNYWSNTFANIGSGSPNSARSTNDLNAIVSDGDIAGVGHSDPAVLDMYFVEIAAGFTQLGDNYANGLAYVGANGSTVHVGDDLVSWSGGRETIARVVAHEIGHNLGLGHVVDTPNLMDDGELLNNSQISTSISSQFSLELPENQPPVVSFPISDVTTSISSNSESIDLSGVFFDSNGDSLTYTVSIEDDWLVSGSFNGSTLQLDLANLAGTTTVTVTATDPQGLSVSDEFVLNVESTVFSGDFDGDGVDDLISWSNGSWDVILSPTDGEASQNIGTWSGSVLWEDLGVGDFNADGRTDVIGRAGGQWWIGLSDGSSLNSQWWGGWSTAVDWQNVFYGDFDGDGRDDVVGRESGNWWISSSTGSGFTSSYWGSWSSTVQWDDVSPGDFNGDGRTDIAGRTGGHWWVGLSTGSNFNTTYWASWSTGVQWKDVLVADFDGNGYDDIVGREGGNLWVALSEASGFTNQYWGSWNSASVEHTRVGDFNADGAADLLSHSGSDWLLAQGGANFSLSTWSVLDGTDWSQARVGDFNGDGASDLSAAQAGQLRVGISSTPPAAPEQVFNGDFNGDGVDDLISWSDGSWDVVFSPTNGESSQNIGTWSNSVSWKDLGVGDFNADGRTDVIGRTGGQWWIGLSNGSSLNSQWWGGWSTAVQWENVHYGDFDGDGRDDVVGWEGGNWWVSSSTGSGFSSSYWGSWSSAVQWDDVSPGDFDGDGKLDIAGRTGGNWWVGLSTGSRFDTSYWTSWSTAVQWHDVLVADFNGDGKDDIVGREAGNLWVALSSSSSFTNQYWGSWGAPEVTDVILADISGDGIADLVGRVGETWFAGVADTRFSFQVATEFTALNLEHLQSGHFNLDARTDLAGYTEGQLVVLHF